MSIKVTNQNQIAKNFEAIANRLGITHAIVQKKLAFDIFSGVVAGTPVDTGRAMNNWNISVGTPDRSTTEDGGDDAGIRSAKNAEALAALGALPKFTKVWISNSLPYIVSLNEGSSEQAPSGYVDRVVENELGTLNLLL